MWITLTGFDLYEIHSETLEIRHKVSRRVKKHSLRSCGKYLYICLSDHGIGRTKNVHRLIMMTLKPVDGMEDLEVNHIDGNGLNNSLDNLEWATREENAKHSSYHEACKVSMKKLSNKDVLEIRDLVLSGCFSQRLIAEFYGVSRTNVSAIATRRSRKYI